MNVLEKILEEIKEVEKKFVVGHKVLFALGAIGLASKITEIIRSHMDDQNGDITEMVGNWIPVEDRLPEKNKTVLVCQRGGVIEVAWHDGYRWKTGFSHAEWLWDVVAWRPMPEPYRPKDIPAVKNTQQEMEDLSSSKI